MKDLHGLGLRGRLPTFIEGFLKNRQFQIKVGSNFSQLYDQEMGVPQGSILSVTLFGLKINSIIKSVAPGVECSLYVDDFLICYRSKYINISNGTSNDALINYLTGPTPVFALSGIASQNATQIDPPCDSKCHMRRTHVRYKRKHRLFDKNTECQGGLRTQSSFRHSSS